VSPSTPVVAPPIIETETISTTQHLTRLAFPLSAACVPAISLPCGLSAAGLPIGLQVAAAPWNDALVLQAGISYQDSTDWHRQRPADSLAQGKEEVANRKLVAGESIAH
jgi:aspartyl-tRNA(Asn)/glutamyl-tRNA(Gln) amidotransferase subunit A